MKVAVKTLDGKESGDITLNKDVFGVEVRADVMHRMVNYQLAKRRGGHRKTQQRHEVTGTGKKPWAQKGTGRARAGDLKRPQDRGGARPMGPVVRDHSFNLPKKIKQLALKSALSSKVKEGKLIILDNVTAKSHKTKPMADTLKKLGVNSAVIVSGEQVDVNFARATANIPLIDVLPSMGANVYDILRRDVLVLTKDAVDQLTERLK